MEAITDDAKKRLDKIIEQTTTLLKRREMKLNVSITETTTKQTITASQATAPIHVPISYNLPKIADLSAKLKLTPVTDAIGDVFTTFSRGKDTRIAPMVDFDKATQNISRKAVAKVSNSPIAQEKPTIVETTLNLDGNMIARVISDKIDARNGVKYTVNQRRFAY